MRLINTVYPCGVCNEEIDPTASYCQHCGAKQKPVNEKLHYTVFHRRIGSEGAFHISFGGHILTLEDATELFLNSADRYEGRDVYIGSYLLGTSDEIDEDTRTYHVQHWIKLHPNGPQFDKGPQDVIVTRLE